MRKKEKKRKPANYVCFSSYVFTLQKSSDLKQPKPTADWLYLLARQRNFANLLLSGREIILLNKLYFPYYNKHFSKYIYKVNT